MTTLGTKTSLENAAAAITGSAQTIVRAVQGGANVKLTDDQLRTWAQIFVSLLDLSNASAGQIKFPASQNASADANTLDDYEEGTFTPALSAATPPTGVTYGTQHGSYTKIGNAVEIKVRVILTSKGSGGVGAISLTGLPFTSAAVACALTMSDWDLINLNTNYTHAGASVAASATSININENGDNVSGAGVTWANIANTTSFAIGGRYFV